MAIKQEKVMAGGQVLIHTYSDKRKKIKCGNYVYDDAYDVAVYDYAETDEDVSSEFAETLKESELAELRKEIEKLKAEQATQNEAIEASADGLTDLITTVMGGE